MRYLSPGECATAATALCLIWLCLGRGAERSIGRTYERAFLEHVSEEPGLGFYVDLCQRQWDRFCPIFFQRRVFVPRWNRKTHSDVHDHIAAYRSKDFREHRHALESAACRGAMYYGASVRDGGPPPIIEETLFQKLAAGVLMALGSFTASSPHFFLNLMTVFCSSMGLGMSLSLQCMETGRGPSDDRNTNKRSIFSPFSLNTVVIAFLIIGNLVGSSGGVVFLAEFIVTSVSLVLGGAGTISASAVESWGCFICLSSTAFWGYLLIDGMRQQRRGTSSVFLCGSLVAMSVLWMIVLFAWDWASPPLIMIARHAFKESGSQPREMAAQHLQ